MKYCNLIVALLATLVCGGLVNASGVGTVNIEFVHVGDAGNPEIPVDMYDGQGNGYGAVGHEFQIGKYEVTNDQYSTFLNAVAKIDDFNLYDPKMGSEVYGGILRSGSSGSYSYSAKTHFGNKPVNYISFYDAARFANWMHNGQQQSAATAEFGAYSFSGEQTLSARNSDATFFIPSEHEWKKAAFYEPGANTIYGDGWWRRFGGQDFDKPTDALVNATGDVINPGPLTVVRNRASNWNGSENESFVLGNVATVGSAGSKSFYGAYDMAGNVFEWTEADPTKPDPNGWGEGGPYMVLGGTFRNEGHFDVHDRNLIHHVNHNRPNNAAGFRLAAAVVAVPEPSSLAFASSLGVAFLIRRRRRS